MEDSFFGFDTSISYDEDGSGGQIEEPSEEEYDALNDETFGSAINTDWEEAHENMVRLDDHLVDVDDDLLVEHVRKLANNNSLHNSSRQFAADNDKTTINSNAGLLHSNRSRNQSKPSTADSDLELNLANMKLDEVDFRFNESFLNANDIGAISMDPSVWSSNPMQMSKNFNAFGNNNNNVVFSSQATRNGLGETSRNSLNDSFSNSMPQQQQQHGLPKLPVSSKICTLEDIERNIILGQTMQKQQQQQNAKPLTPIQQQQQAIEKMKMSPQPLQQKGMPQQSPLRPSNNFQQNQQQHPLGALMQQQQQQTQPTTNQHPIPPGFPPMYAPGYMTNQNYSQLPVHHPLLTQQPQHNLHPLHPLQRQQLPIALNNFAMHPNFNPMRAASAATINLLAAAQQQQQQPPLPPPSNAIDRNIGMVNNQQQYNMMNMRMMQEIQQNHPMLQQQQRSHLLQQQQQYHMQQHLDPRNNKIHPLQLQQQLQHQQHYHQQQQQMHLQQQQHRNNRSNMANQREYDEYANLMSTRDKHWLIGIQLSQLNVDTPYIDDFYFTVYKERQAELKGELRNSKAHKDNQLNHPLIQPRGHAQLILVQLGNKNGTRNGQNRERRNSDANNYNAQNNYNNSHNNINNHHNSLHNNHNNPNNNQEKSPYVFTPMKFENSLGKLQYGSVTAPRKIIDADIMGTDAVNLNASNAGNGNAVSGALVSISNGYTPVRPKTPAVTTLGAGSYILAGSGTGSSNMVMIQHRTRDLLLHIETLFRIVLKLEDLKNPAAVQSIKLKKKKEAERLAVMEQQENANKTQDEISNAANATATTTEDNGNQTKPKFYYEIEPQEELLENLMSGLTADKVISIMNVRKGKILMRRVLPFITDDNLRWNIWIAIFQSLQNVMKKDRDDNEGLLYALYPEFKSQIQNANFKTVMRFSNAMSLNEKKSDGIFCSRFGISALVCLVTRAEQIYQMGSLDISLDSNLKKQWPEFLNQMATSLNRTIQNQTICAAIETDSIQPLMNHVKRFKDLQLDALLALIAKARKQIN